MAKRVGRGSLTGRWEPRLGACPNIRGGITIERDLPVNTKLWLTGWTKTNAGGEFVSVLVEIADECREAVPDEDLLCAPTVPCATDEAHGALGCDRVSRDATYIEVVEIATRSPFSSAERMRLHRKRRRTGVRCVRIALHLTDIDGLIRKRYLEPKHRDNQNEIQMAVDAFINDTLGAGRDA